PSRSARARAGGASSPSPDRIRARRSRRWSSACLLGWSVVLPAHRPLRGAACVRGPLAGRAEDSRTNPECQETCAQPRGGGRGRHPVRLLEPDVVVPDELEIAARAGGQVAEIRDEAVLEHVRQRDAQVERRLPPPERGEPARELHPGGAQSADVQEGVLGHAVDQRDLARQDGVLRLLPEIVGLDVRAVAAQVMLHPQLDLRPELRLQLLVAEASGLLGQPLGSLVGPEIDVEGELLRERVRRTSGAPPGAAQLAGPAVTRLDHEGRAELRVELEAEVVAERGVAIRAQAGGQEEAVAEPDLLLDEAAHGRHSVVLLVADATLGRVDEARDVPGRQDRKSTRLNSSHVKISYV